MPSLSSSTDKPYKTSEHLGKSLSDANRKLQPTNWTNYIYWMRLMVISTVLCSVQPDKNRAGSNFSHLLSFALGLKNKKSKTSNLIRVLWFCGFSLVSGNFRISQTTKMCPDEMLSNKKKTAPKLKPYSFVSRIYFNFVVG